MGTTLVKRDPADLGKKIGNLGKKTGNRGFGSEISHGFPPGFGYDAAGTRIRTSVWKNAGFWMVLNPLRSEHLRSVLNLFQKHSLHSVVAALGRLDGHGSWV